MFVSFSWNEPGPLNIALIVLIKLKIEIIFTYCSYDLFIINIFNYLPTCESHVFPDDKFVIVRRDKFDERSFRPFKGIILLIIIINN